MISEQLITPHPNKTQPESGSRPLLEVLNVEQLTESLSHAQQTDARNYQEKSVEATAAIAHEVHRALWYPEVEGNRNDFEALGIPEPVTLDELGVQAANCYGYAYITSEVLDQVGVKHWIGYAGGPLPHAFILLPPNTETNNGVHFIDPLMPHLNHEMGKSIQRTSMSRLVEQVDNNGRGAFMLNTSIFSDELGEKHGDLSARHPWLVYAKNQNHHYREQRTQAPFDRKHLLVTTVYDSGSGREMLDVFGRYKQAIETDDREKAITMLQKLAGTYPSIDARQDHEEIRSLVDWLTEQGQTEKALDMLHGYFESFSISKDTRITEAYADIQLRLAQHTGSVALAETAEVIYIETYKKPKCFKNRLVSKIQKARATKDVLAAEQNEIAGQIAQ